MLVGDSIMRNQWESLVCLVQGVVPTGHKKVIYNGPSMAFHALVRYAISNMFYWLSYEILFYLRLKLEFEAISLVIT